MFSGQTTEFCAAVSSGNPGTHQGVGSQPVCAL